MDVWLNHEWVPGWVDRQMRMDESWMGLWMDREVGAQREARNGTQRGKVPLSKREKVGDHLQSQGLRPLPPFQDFPLPP